MLKSELVFLEIFLGAKTQKEIAQKLHISLSTVNNALEPLSRIGAVEKRKFGLKIIDREKMLIYWASVRNIEKDIVYKTRINNSVIEIEKSVPAGIVFTAFSAFRLKFKEVPADYSEVYVYANDEELSELKKRFALQDGPANFIVLRKNKVLEKEEIVPNELMFVDLWNLKEWYAKEFLKELKNKMGLEY
ncbi:MAG: winged helix-turn-helix transcriptional regulator [archaeon]|nr:winged helix-turn-helix transcriptional regulator [archaeon]